ncbi:MAG TPA: outer membrane beta-barrel protein, partial [Fimbriimonas sp.]|nr:outer membrane beta-barrel protein [Fimbriimonas sp.]
MNRTLTLALTTVLASAAFAGDEFKFSGWLDTYYQHDFNKSALGTNLAGRQFDPRAGTFELASAQVNFKWTRSEAFSLVAELALGRTPGISSAYDAANGNSNQIFQQLYASFTQKNGATLDIGKFNTWVGYESVYVVDNANYSLATLTNFAQPTWHVGARYSKPVSETSSFSLYLVNGWNETNDTNSSKTYGATFSKAVGEDKNLTFNYIGG